MSAPTDAQTQPGNDLPAGTRVEAGTGESLVPAGTRGTVVLAAGDGVLWPAVRYDGRVDAVFTDPRWITPVPPRAPRSAPAAPPPLEQLGAQLYDITED